MKINIICVGKLKEKYLIEAQDEYVKRLSRFCDVKITEVSDEKDDIPDAMEKEGARILSKSTQRLCDMSCDRRHEI